jgi:hypothetical protein
MARDPYSLLGKYVLIGVTRIAADVTFLERGERHGRIALVDQDAGIRIVLADGEVLTLPPNPDAFPITTAARSVHARGASKLSATFAATRIATIPRSWPRTRSS